MTWKKRIISIALCLCALLCAASVRAEAADHTNHLVCGGTTCDHKTGTHITNTPTWTAWDGTDTIGNDFFKDSDTKYLYLSRDVEISNKWTDTKVPEGKTLYLCLNGHSLTRKASNYTIYVEGTLVLCDCNGNGSGRGKGAISHGEKDDGSLYGAEGVYVTKNATFTMYGGKICNNNGGVLVSDGTFTMYDGEISGNTRTETSSSNSSGGGGVCVKKYWDGGQDIGKFYMYGGKICNNTYIGPNLGGGGVYASGTGEFIIQGGEITGNQCSYNGTNTSNGAFGGGLYISDAHSKLRIENSTISNNTCDGEGGGIFAISSGESSITNCTISGNSATGTNSLGGGLTFQNSTFTLKECAITDNKTAGQGGAICLMTSDANLTLSNGLKFSGNVQGCTADENGKLTGGTESDVHLNSSSAYLRLASDFSKTSGAIVVTTAFEPNANGYKKIAVDNRTTPDPTDFKYGNDDTAICTYTVTEGGNKTVELRACKHSGAWKPNTDDASSGHWRKCTNCDTTETASHSGGEASCTKKAVCQVCNQPYGGYAAHVYDMTMWVKIDSDHHGHKCKNCNAIDETSKAPHSWNAGEVTTQPKCEEIGEKTYTCETCNATKTEEIPASGHTEVIDAAVEATCTKTGLTEGKHCSVCNTVLVEQTTVPAKGHTEVTDAAVEATCTEPGKTEGKHCSVCNAVLVKQNTIPATGHTQGAAVCENKVAATCTTAGSYDEVVYCTACGNELSRTQKTIDKLAHDYDTTKWVKADENQHGHKCKNCDAITNLAAHDPGAAATETTPQLCTKCGYVIAPATHPVHTWVFVAKTPATCNATGEREHYKCTCGRTSFKNGDTYDVNEDASVLTIEKNSTNHTGAPDSKWLSDSENHWQEYTCCHAKANEAAHSGGAATCMAQAVCGVCGRAYGATLGHDWGAWEVTTPATKDAPGVETRTCTHNSAHTETRSIPKLSTTVYTVSEDTKIAQIEAKVDGLDKILDSEENKQLVNDGKSVGVSLTVKNTASSGVSEKIKEKLAGSNLVGLRLELTVEKTVTANGVVESKQTIPDTVEPLKTTITLPTELQGKSGYVVYRLHGDAVHVLTETPNANGEFITVSADKTQITICARLYSEYVIAYQTSGSSGGGYHPVNPTPAKATSANTGDAGVLLYGVTAALSLTGTAWLGAKSRKH